MLEKEGQRQLTNIRGVKILDFFSPMGVVVAILTMGGNYDVGIIL